jgi:hypothetical protein
MGCNQLRAQLLGGTLLQFLIRYLVNNVVLPVYHAIMVSGYGIRGVCMDDGM